MVFNRNFSKDASLAYDTHQVTAMAEIDALQDGIVVDGPDVAVILFYFIAGYAPSDYHAESTQVGDSVKSIVDPHDIDPKLVQNLAYDALVWCSLRGLLVGDRNSEKSGTVPGVGMVHAPVALLPMSFPESHWKQACEVAPIFNELVDRVSQDGEFLQESLSRTKKVDPFTSRLLEIHSKMLEINKIEEIRLGLHRSDYMLDEQTKLLLQIELNTISSSFPGLGCLVSELHRSLIQLYKEHIDLDPNRIPTNNAVNQFAEALAKAWNEYGDPRAVVMFVVQSEERNMYDQHWLSASLRERYPTLN
ncbi:Glutathione synthetase, chloroplastic [Capsicum annuum]|nr:Glutathione synthetase, chloroplastic [Capsicum annuum]KAF3632778.1 Glutathione synthetase, chloroplastic [Capsicum annuum]